jgi:hypothetical protein
MKIYQCDNDNCSEKASNLDEWLEIGSVSGKNLKIKNNLPGRNLVSMSNHTDLHFCSAQCLISRFVDKLIIT